MPNILFLMYARLFSAWKGYRLWHSIIHRYKVPADCALILLPSSADEACALYAVKYLKAFLRCNPEFRCAIFLSSYPWLDGLIKRYQAEGSILRVIPLGEKETEQLIDFYNANLNDERLIVASLTIPCGRNALDYMNTKVLSKEEIFAVGIYNILNDSACTSSS